MATSYNRLELARAKRVLIPVGNVTAGKVASDVVMTNYLIANAATAETIYIPLDPTQETSIMLSHNSTDVPIISGTITALDTDDLEDSDVNWFVVYDGTATPYAAADTRPLIGLRIVANPANGEIAIDVLQTRRNR